MIFFIKIENIGKMFVITFENELVGTSLEH